VNAELGKAWCAAAALAFCTAAPRAAAAQNLESALRRDGATVIYDGRRSVAYGTVVSADGLVLTKASEVKDAKSLAVRIDDREFRAVQVVATDSAWDLALLKVEAGDLVPVKWSEQADIAQGTWVVANGATSRARRRALAGIVSAKAREIRPAGGAGLGVILDADAKLLRIAEVLDGGGGKAAGLKKGDVILTLEGKEVKAREDMIKGLESRKAGQTVKVVVRREEKELEFEVRLSPKAELFGDQMSRNDAMSGHFSARRSGFPRVLQHDVLGANDSI